ncbi:MAG: hypothetical protein ACYC6A_09325 [Armatimonadota bacterium]
MTTETDHKPAQRFKRPPIERLYRVAVGLAVVGSLFLLFGLLLFAALDVPGIIADLIDALGTPFPSGNGILLILALAALLCTVLGMLLVLASWRKAGGTYSAMMWTMLLGVFSILLTFFSYSGIELAHSHHPNTQVNCVHNLRQLSIAMLSYAQDHDNTLPMDWTATAALLPPRVLICPATNRRFHKHGGYGMNANLVGKQIDNFQHPESLLLFADSVKPGMQLSSEQDIALRHPAGQAYFCSHLDGSAERCLAGAAIRWK